MSGRQTPSSFHNAHAHDAHASAPDFLALLHPTRHAHSSTVSPGCMPSDSSVSTSAPTPTGPPPSSFVLNRGSSNVRHTLGKKLNRSLASSQLPPCTSLSTHAAECIAGYTNTHTPPTTLTRTLKGTAFSNSATPGMSSWKIHRAFGESLTACVMPLVKVQCMTMSVIQSMTFSWCSSFYLRTSASTTLSCPCPPAASPSPSPRPSPFPYAL